MRNPRLEDADFYLRFAEALERGALKHPCGSPCQTRKLDLAKRARLKAAMILEKQQANAAQS